MSITIPEGYKHSTFGNIPEHWEVKELGDIAKIKRGRFSPRPRNDPKFYGGNIPFVQTSDVTLSGGHVSTFAQTLNEDGLKVSMLFPKGTILMTIASNIGYCAILEIDMACPDSLVGINCNENLNNEFLNYFLRLIRKRIAYVAPGAQKNINIEFLNALQIIYPPLAEQQKIVIALNLADKVLRNISQLISKKELQKKALMQQLLTGKKRLKGFDEKWKKFSAGEIFKSVSKKGLDNEDLLSATQDGGIIPRSMLPARVTMPTGDTLSFKLVEKGDFVISLRSFQGGLEYSYYRGVVSPADTVLKPKKPINDEFYKQYYKSYDFIGHLATAVIGIRDGKQISYDDFCLVQIPYPSLEEQIAIAQVLQTADKEIQLLKTKAEKLKEQKKGMMQVLLTGKKRLKVSDDSI